MEGGQEKGYRLGAAGAQCRDVAGCLRVTDQELVAGAGIRVRKTLVEELDNGSQAGVQGLGPMDYVGTLGGVGRQPKTVTPGQ